jgi:hypothetical protein
MDGPENTLEQQLAGCRVTETHTDYFPKTLFPLTCLSRPL